MHDRAKPARGPNGPSPTLTFFKQWLKNPLSVAALSPSSRQLARLMVRELPKDAERVVELGGGTGVFTQAMLEHGIEPQRLMVVELNAELHQFLHQRFPDVRVVCGDARQLPALVDEHRFGDSPVDAIVSGLGLLSMPKSLQREILEGAFAVLPPEGRYIQFTYGPVSPVGREILDDLGLVVRRGGFAWWNIPPASVFVYTRSRSKPIHPVRAKDKT
ncbi:class I SAM-dependent methyltransferase [Tahibacter soli]|jgi:phospholipid N-methyltransferase|uniref:Methyltransferase domain-containing protein n=1 Tax=Tahibacter soli TaxID=2983605 RepID=A0A9X4BFX2_9GAMM|nr:methyltransferase domain-containing protein [Tahibacter soli]MDC8011850.1 methyltransferase domain-containing protein [Tahibacter soli]